MVFLRVLNSKKIIFDGNIADVQKINEMKKQFEKFPKNPKFNFFLYFEEQRFWRGEADISRLTQLFSLSSQNSSIAGVLFNVVNQYKCES